MSRYLLFLIFINLVAYSQTYQSYLPYGNEIKTCKFFGENVGYYILNGLVYKTTNSGEDWNVIYKSGQKNFLKTAFSDENNFWIVTNTNIIHSKDGGLTFDILTKPGNIEDISFCDSLYGWVVVGNYSLYKTTNGGITWNFFYTTIFARNVQLVTRNIGYVSDYFHLLKTTNGGNNFYSVFSSSAMIYFNFTSPDTGMVNYYALNSDWNIHTTTNGGNSWAQRYGIINGHVDYTDYFYTTIIITGMYYTGIAFLWVSTDTGNSWVKSNGKYFREISSINENLIYGIDNISLIKITNMGSEWHRCPIIPPITFSKIKGSGNIEWIIGSYFDADSNKTFSYLFEKILKKFIHSKTGGMIVNLRPFI